MQENCESIMTKKIGIKSCLTGHCYCKMRNDGKFFCCKCAQIENEPELRVDMQKASKK